MKKVWPIDYVGVIKSRVHASEVFQFTLYRHKEKSVQEPRVVVPEVLLLLEGD